MEKAIHESMNAALRILEKQAVIANNLANISTIGFKEEFNSFIQDVNLKNINKKSNQNIKKYYNFSSGNFIQTERKLDLVVQNDGWLVTRDNSGQEGYTKNGHITINQNGRLTVQNYELILNEGDVKIPNGIDLKILSDGTIKQIQKNHGKFTESQIATLKLVRISTDNLIKKENGLFYNRQTLSNKSKTFPHDNGVRIKSEILEASNVNPTKNMIDMISNARNFEMNMKIISISDQNIERANQLFNISN